MAASDLGIRIKRARERKRWNQKQLADAVGKGVRSVGRWERGEAVPRSAIGALEAVLGVDLTNGGEEPEVLEIRELAARLRWTPAQQDAWVASYEARKSPRDGAQRAG